MHLYRLAYGGYDPDDAGGEQPTLLGHGDLIPATRFEQMVLAVVSRAWAKAFEKHPSSAYHARFGDIREAIADLLVEQYGFTRLEPVVDYTVGTSGLYGELKWMDHRDEHGVWTGPYADDYRRQYELARTLHDEGVLPLPGRNPSAHDSLAAIGRAMADTVNNEVIKTILTEDSPARRIMPFRPVTEADLAAEGARTGQLSACFTLDDVNTKFDQQEPQA